MSKTFAICLVVAVLVGCLAFGVARDLYSTQRAKLTGEVVEVNAGAHDFKSSIVRAPSLTVKLSDGRIVHVATTSVASVQVGANVSVLEMATPWGQVWYQLASN